MQTTDFDSPEDAADFEAFSSNIRPEEEEDTTDEAPLEATEPEAPEAADDDQDAATDDDVAETADEADQKEPQRLTVKVDGKDVEVTLDDLKRSYSGQAYIQKGMQEAAQAKKQADQLLQSLQSEQQRVLAFAQQVQAQGLIAPPKLPDPDLANKDPVGYIRAKAQYDAKLSEFHRQQSEIQAMQLQQRHISEAQQQAFLQIQAATLREKIPEFANPETAAKVRDQLIKTGAEVYGYSRNELESIQDARAVQVLRDAMKYRELIAKTKAAKKDPAPSRNVKPTAKRPEPAQLSRTKLIQKATKSQSAEDWVNAFLVPKT